MKLNYIILILFIILLIGSCSSWKGQLVAKGNQSDAVQNAVIDFLNSSSLSKKDDVFSVVVENLSDDILAVSILGNDNKLSPGPDTKIGSRRHHFPSRYIEKEDKLFYWADSTYALNRDMVDVLSKYEVIDSTNVNGVSEISFNTDDSKKGVDYYFCKKNLEKYKKVTTSIGLGYYDAPKLDCN